MARFSAQVSAWTRKCERRQRAVFQTSTQILARNVRRPVGRGGRMRVDTGFLRASLMASTSAMPQISRDARPQDGRTYAPDNSVELVLLGLKSGDTLWLGFTAAYAGFRESRDAFVRTEAQRWPQIVDEATARVRRSVR